MSSSSSLASLLEVELDPDRPPILRVQAPGDPTAWAAEHRDALRACVNEHGVVLVAAWTADMEQVSAVFTATAGELMTEKEAFAPRERQPGLYSSATWPANQPMCMHHELSYTLEIPA